MKTYRTLKRSAGRFDFGPGQEIELPEEDAKELMESGAVCPADQELVRPTVPADDEGNGGGGSQEGNDDRLLADLGLDSKTLGILNTNGLMTAQHAIDFDNDDANEGGLVSLIGIGESTADKIREACKPVEPTE